MTFLELVQTFVGMAGIAPTTQPATVADQTGRLGQAVGWVQAAHEEIQNLHTDWDFLWGTSTFNTAEGTATYSGPADLSMWDTQRMYVDGEPLQVILWQDYQPWTISPSRPSTAVLRPDNAIQMVPVPDKAYTVTFDYFKAPKVLVVDGDEPLIPARYRRIIVGRALMLYANFEAAEEVKLQGTEIYQQYLQALENDQLARRQQAHGRTESRPIMVVAE